VVSCLEQNANDLHTVQLMPLPPHHLCFIKTKNGSAFLVLAYQGCPEKWPLNGRSSNSSAGSGDIWHRFLCMGFSSSHPTKNIEAPKGTQSSKPQLEKNIHWTNRS